jgi:hypothetical protein
MLLVSRKHGKSRLFIISIRDILVVRCDHIRSDLECAGQHSYLVGPCLFNDHAHFFLQQQHFIRHQISAFFRRLRFPQYLSVNCQLILLLAGLLPKWDQEVRLTGLISLTSG